MPSWHLPRTSQVYVKEESAYGTAPTFAATDAVRHIPGLMLKFNKANPVKTPDRSSSLSHKTMLTRRQSASWALPAQLYPSGTLNTLPELAALLKAAFGAAPQNITLATTFSGTPTTTTGTIASATGLVAGQMVEINIAGVGTFIRRLTTATTSAVWTPALPSAPASGDTFKGMVTWTPSSATPITVDVAHYPQAPAASVPAREMLGCVVEQCVIDIDSNTEGKITFSGPAKGYAGSSPSYTPQAQPGAFTTVGAEGALPSGLTGYFYWAGTLYQVQKVQITMKLNRDVQNTALGTSAPVAVFVKNKRDVSVKINAKVSDDTTLWAARLGQTAGELFLQLGTTSTKIWALSLQNVLLHDDADIPDGSDEPVDWDFVGDALGVSGNDEVILGMG